MKQDFSCLHFDFYFDLHFASVCTFLLIKLLFLAPLLNQAKHPTSKESPDKNQNYTHNQ